MAKNIVILGAGASKSAGAPLMFDFLDRAESILVAGQCGKFESDFKRVFAGIRALHHTLAKARLDVNNLESVFCAFEMAELCGRLDGIPGDGVGGLCTSMQNVILRTLEMSVQFQQRSDGAILPPIGYNELSEHFGNSVKKDWAFITFNYDLALDVALRIGTASDPDYGFGSTATGGQPLLKLHGSLHWHENTQHGVQSVPLASLLTGNHRRSTMPNRWYIVVSDSHGFGTPVVVPPTWRKGDHYMQISSVWRRCAQELADAENIYVCGFSLPETDQFFRYLFAVGSSTASRMKSFTVFDPNPEVEDRYRSLLGQAALSRFLFEKKTFPEFVGLLGRNMKG